MHKEIDIPENQITIAGTEFMPTESSLTVGGQASLCEAVVKKSDHSRRFLVKHFYENGETDEALYESEALAQAAAANHHQAVLASVLYDRATRTSVMLKASSDCKTLQELMREWEDIPPEDPESEYYDMGRLLESIQIVKSLLGALDGIHNDKEEPMLHMDLSPSNIMWGRNKTHGTVYLIDFGCCVKRDHEVDDRRRTTLSFAAPETGISGVCLTPAADIYSVGAVFLLLVAGAAAASNPPDEEKWSIRELPGSGNLNVTEPIDDLEIPGAYKGKLSEIIIKATTSVDKRYQSASEMLADMVELEKIIAGRGMTPETLIRGSAALFRKECNAENGIFHYELQDDLVTEAVDFESHTPVDILKQNTILLGGGGAGKTTKVRKLWEQCLSDWKKDRKNNPIPVYVPLNTFDSKKSNWDFFIRDYITTVYFPGLSMDVSQRRSDLDGMFESTGKYILFLDGINEAVDSSMLNAEVATLAAIKNVTVIITSRNDWGDDETKKLFSTAELMPLNDELILRKLQNSLGSPSARLLETLRRPMFLALFLKIKVTDKTVETPGQILYEHHKHLIEAYNTGHHGDEWETIVTTALDKILPQLSSQIKKMRFNEEELGIILSTLLNKCRSSMAFEQAETRLISRGFAVRMAILVAFENCGIIWSCGKNEYSFSHQNYLEFYQALDIYNQMEAHKIDNPLPKCLCESILTEAITSFLSDLWDEHNFDKRSWSDKFSPLEGWMQTNCVGKQGREAQMTVGNLIEAMKSARGQMLTNCCFNGLDLSGSNFYFCDIRESTFTNAIVGENLLFFAGHHQNISGLKIASKKRIIITYSKSENRIIAWSINTLQSLYSILLSGQILDYDISPDEEYLVVSYGHPRQTSIYALEIGKKLQIDINQYHPENFVFFSSDSKALIFDDANEGIVRCSLFSSDRELTYYLRSLQWFLKKDSGSEHSASLPDFKDMFLASCLEKDKIDCAIISPDRKNLLISFWLPDLENEEFVFLSFVIFDLETETILLQVDRWTSCHRSFGLSPRFVFPLDGKSVIGRGPIGQPTSVSRDTYISLVRIDIGTKSYSVEKIAQGDKRLEMDQYIISEDEPKIFLEGQKALRPDYFASKYSVSEDGNLLVCLTEGQIRIFDLVKKCILSPILANIRKSNFLRKTIGIDFADNNTIISYNDGGAIEYINLRENLYQRFTGTFDPFLINPFVPIVCCENGQYILSRKWTDPVATIWDASRRKIVGFYSHNDTRRTDKAYCFLEHKKLVAITHASAKSCAIIYPIIDELSLPISDKYDGILLEGSSCVVINSLVVLGNIEGHVQLWDLDGNIRHDVCAHHDGVLQILRVLGNSYFVTISRSHNVMVWDSKTFQSWPVEVPSSVFMFGMDIITSTPITQGDFRSERIVFPNGELFWWCNDHTNDEHYDLLCKIDDMSRRIAIWDKYYNDLHVCKVENGETLLFIEDNEMPKNAASFTLSPDGSRLAITTSNDEVVVFDIPDEYKKVDALEQHRWKPSCYVDMRGSHFEKSHLIGDKSLRGLLKLNGAIVDEE